MMTASKGWALECRAKSADDGDTEWGVQSTHKSEELANRYKRRHENLCKSGRFEWRVTKR